MTLPLVSVIIPVYNSKLFIRETINSILNQTFPSIEIILVDDGSTDGVSSLFPEFEVHNIKCISTNNYGASHARNVGLKASKGNYIQYLDSDDILAPNKIALQIEDLLSNNADISFCKWSNFKTNIDPSKPFKFWNVNYSNCTNGIELLTCFGMDNWFIPIFSWLTKRELILKAGLWNESISNNDDGEFFTRVLVHAQRLSSVNEILAFYRVIEGQDSLSKINSIEKIDSAFRSYDLILNTLTQYSETTDVLSYPKRLYYIQFLLLHDNYPVQSKKAARAFDSIKGPSFLMRRKKYWKLINLIGLYRASLIYNFIIRKLF
jgi:glycosyltransferase involved in cell wall biosynthesis